MDIAASSDIGKVRKENEDQYLVAHLGRWMHVEHTSVGAPQELTRPQGTLFVIADGMGGQGGGDVASAVTLDAFVAHSLLEMPWLGSGTSEGDALLAADMTRFVAECQLRLHEVAARARSSRRASEPRSPPAFSTMGAWSWPTWAIPEPTRSAADSSCG
jgi:serine/threonine protein phosphatase PrpC